MSFLWLQIIITKYTGQQLKKVERVAQTLSQESFHRFWNNFDFVPPMIPRLYNLTYIVYRKYL